MLCPVAVAEDGQYYHMISKGFAVQYDPQHEPHEVMQYTGQHDKTGVEIFEGDIFAGREGEHDGEVWEVAWEEDRDRAGWSITPGIAEEGEVIGNRYENPELLEGT